ncbi:MAG: hypothetical protein ACR2N4_04615 [Jatrophihabitans sp.]
MAPMMRRAAWPTMALTVLALLGVLGVLLLTGATSPHRPSFVLSVSPAVQPVRAGDTVQFRVEVRAAAGFHGSVQLSTTALPDGLHADLAPSSITLSQGQPAGSATLSISTSGSAVRGTVGLGVIGRSGPSVQGSNLSLQVSATSITDAGPPPPVAATGIDFSISGSPRGVLKPGARLPVDLRLGNPNRQRLIISALAVTLVSTSDPACAISNFAISQYLGPARLAVPAGRSSTLTELGVPPADWPQLSMLNLASNQDSCKGVTVNLRYDAAGAGG